MQTNPRTFDAATDWVARLLDPGFRVVEDDLESANPIAFPGYQPPTPGESVIAASGTAGGFSVEVVAFDFSVFGGSLGVVAGERIARAFERAVNRNAGVVALLSTGGARMQEGMAALAQMAKTVVARQALAKASLPFIAYLGHPTTGGAYASFGGLADIIWAEPGATVGFAGPRVAEEMSGRPLPEGSHTAEFALERGLIDNIVPPHRLKASVVAVFDVLLGHDEPAELERTVLEPAGASDGWSQVQLARRPDRPTARAIAERVATGIVEISGDRAGTSRIGLLAGIGRIAGRRVSILAHERVALPPAAFRATQRLVRLAGRFGLPLVTFVDTPGADPSSSSEAGGIVRAISGAFRDVLEHPRPVVAVVTGEGGSGGALAFACADRLLILEHAIFSVIAPEGAGAILRRTDIEAVAADLRLTAEDLVQLGVADAVLAEPGPGAHADPEGAAAVIKEAVATGLREAVEDPRAARAEKWRTAGNAFFRRP